MIDRERMRALAAAQGVALSDLQLEQLDRYADTLVEANQKMNLTAIVDRQGIEEKHFVDSLLLVTLLPEGCKSLIDVGTGAGFPGVVAKVALPGLRLTLLDSLQKRVTFLEELSAHLGFGGVTCLHGRAEESGRDPALREQFDAATARAVADLAVLAEYCLPFVRLGGRFFALKGPACEEELERAVSAIALLGGEVVGVHPQTLPDGSSRNIVEVKKISQTPTKYPRNAGKIKKNPL